MIRCLFLAALAMATPASAHLKLTSSAPAANARVAKPGKIVLTFSDTMVASSFKAELVMLTMPGMADHPPMKMSGYTIQMNTDGKSVNLLMKRALPAGGYLLKWSVTGTDKHPVSGEVPFTVK